MMAVEVALFGGPADGAIQAVETDEDHPPLWHVVYTQPNFADGELSPRNHRYLRELSADGWIYRYQGEGS